MAASKSGTNDLNSTSDENKAPVTKSNVDATKLNDLMANLDKRLAGGLHGEYFEKGSKLEDKHRHGQLESVFGLRKELSEIKAQMDKQSQQAEPEQMKGNKAAPAANKNMIATIKNVVQQELSDKLRDLSVRIDRIADGVKKGEGRNDAVESKVKGLESKLKKADERNQNLQDKFSQSYVKVLEKRMKKIEADNATLHTQLTETERRVTSDIAAQRQTLHDNALRRIGLMQQAIARHENGLTRVNQLADDLADAQQTLQLAGYNI